jgi:CrcB protein
MNFYKFLVVGIGGMLGSLLRFVVSRSVDEKVRSLIPFGTFTVNIVGSFILGLVYALALRKPGLTENWRLFLGAGFCGGFTTFSTFAWENMNLLTQKNFLVSAGYVASSLVLGIFAVFLGVWAGRSF